MVFRIIYAIRKPHNNRKKNNKPPRSLKNADKKREIYLYWKPIKSICNFNRIFAISLLIYHASLQFCRQKSLFLLLLC